MWCDGRMKFALEIARGAIGHVERVEMPDGTVVARKTFDPKPEFVETEIDRKKQLARFQREVRVQSQLSADHFVSVLSSDLAADPPWYTMPLSEKNFETEIVSTHKSAETPTSALLDILNGLAELHRLGFVHRDLKPQNILFLDGTWKIADFGLVLASSTSDTRATSTNTTWGTEWYCAPEQKQAFRSATAATDIYAFGCILHDIFGRPRHRVPYGRQTAKGRIGKVIERCTDVDPKKRYTSIDALRGALVAVLAVSKDAAPPPDPEGDAWIAALSDLPAWTPERLSSFVSYLHDDNGKEAESIWGHHRLAAHIDAEKLRALKGIDDGLWGALVDAYSTWTRGAFPWEFCDVIPPRLEAIFDVGGLTEKSLAAVSMAIVGSSHHRFAVMRRVVALCGRGMADDVAERVALDIKIDAAHEAFIGCVDDLHYANVDSFHPTIAAVLNEWTSDRR